MFLYQLKTALVGALTQVFNADYPVADFRDLPIVTEFPDSEQQYPGIWVTWEPEGNISRAGIDNHQYAPWAPTDIVSNPNDLFRYRFAGYSLFTVGAMTSLQRDRLHDEVVRTLLVNADPSVVGFRQYIENNPYVALNMDFDNVGTRGMSENPGTPWGTSDFIYECTLAIETWGEFIADRFSPQLAPLAEIILTGTATDMSGNPTTPIISIDVP